MSNQAYKEKIKSLSHRIVVAQKPIRILHSIAWDASIENGLKKSKFKDLPKIGPDYYSKISLGFEVAKKMDEFNEIILDVDRILGAEDEIGILLKKISQEYKDVVNMLQARGTKKFWTYSKKLYGSPKDKFFDEKNTIKSLGELLDSILNGIEDHPTHSTEQKSYTSAEVVAILNERFKGYFAASDAHVKAVISDGIIADASAGGDVVKIKEGITFTSKDIDIFEVHEGWVHVGTTQNGHLQSVAEWLSKGPPRCSSTQEGLAVIMEILTFRTNPRRARHINDRILGIDKAEEGANALELIEFYRTKGYTEEECLTNTGRVFRGGVISGGAPFTKDISYCKGFVENYNFMTTAVRAGQLQLLPFLFAGKLCVDDVPMLYQKHKEGIVDFPHYLPQQFKDLNGIAVWMSFSSFFNRVDLERTQEHYNKLFSKYS